MRNGRTLTGPIAASMPDWLSRGLGLAGDLSPAPRRAPDTLAALIDAGLVDVGEHLEWNGHTATIHPGGVLHHGPDEDEFALTTVTALATHLCGCTVNGWHLWQRTRDHRLLADLRTELATH
jgi:hypothetical protein